MRGCQWHKDIEEEWIIDLLYHATIYYEVRKYIQEAEPNTLKYEMVIEKAKAHEHNILEYKDHQASHGGANSVPSYNNPLLSAHALAKRRPSGWHSNQRCVRCGKSHEWGNCPAYGKTCGKCQGINHFKAICRSKVTAAKVAQSPHREKRPPQHRRTPSARSNNGKGGGKQPKKKMPKKPPKQRAYAVMIKSSNSVPSVVTTTSVGEREKQQDGIVSKMVLSAKVPEKEGMYNRFSCFAVQSKLAQSTNAESLYTDTDPDYRSEIITDVTIRVPGKAGTMMMEVKVDPGTQPSCIPLHIFETMFRHLCRNKLLRGELLDTTQNDFQSCNGADMTCYGYLLIDVKDKVSKMYHPIRFYVVNTDMQGILIGRAASYWLGLVKVLCDNKVPKIKMQVPSVDKKSDFRSESGPFSKGTPHTGSSFQKKQHLSKTVSSSPSRRMHSFQDAKIQGRKQASKSTSGRDVNVNDKKQHTEEEPSEPTEEEPKMPKTGNMTIVKDVPFRKVIEVVLRQKMVLK